jgi:hypothetical protein
MEIEKHHTDQTILAQARASFAPLTCEPLWSRDHDRLGFLVQDHQSRRGVRFSPIKVEVLEQNLGEVLSGLGTEIIRKGFNLLE